MANYITCKDNRAFAYAETTNKGYYEVLSVSEDGSTCHVKTVWHENRGFVGKEYNIPVERASEDFTAVEEMVVVAALERQALMVTGWVTDKKSRFSHQDEIRNNLFNYTSTDFNLWDYNACRDSREFMFIPVADSVSMPTSSIFSGAYERDNARDVAKIVKRIFERTSYTYSDGFIVIPADNFDAIVEESIRTLSEEYRETVAFPDELKLQLRSVEHKVVVLKYDNRFVYLTNVKSDHIVFSSAIFFAEQIGRPLSEDAKAALLERNYEAYCAAIYKDIDAIIDGMTERAKVKMFADFGSNFNGMLIKPLRSAVDRARREYEDWCERLTEAFTKLQDANARLFYAEHGVQDGENEFISFINDVKANIVSIFADPSHNRIDFCIRTFLTYWDDDLWDIIRNSDDRFKRLSNWQKLMLDEIFKDRTIKLLIEQKFMFDTKYAKPQRNNDYIKNPYGEGTKGLRNPHISEYDCWGTHERFIRDSLSSADYLQAYSQAVACISGLTLSDSPVMNRFFDTIRNSDWYNLPCLYVVETGTYISMNDYKQLVADKKWEA